MPLPAPAPVAPPPLTRAADPIGALLLVVSAFCYSTLAIFGKLALGEGMNLASILALRFALATVALGVAYAIARARGAGVPLSRRQHVELFLCGLVGLAGQAGLFFAALHTITASLAEVLLYTCPAFLAINLWVLRRRRPGGVVLAAILLCLGGTWLVTAPVWDGASAIGVGFGLGAGLWFSLFALALDRASRGAGSVLPAFSIVAGAGLSYALALPWAGGFTPPRTPTAVTAILGMVITATLLGLPLFVAGMRRTGPQVAAVLSTFEPLGTLVLAAMLLGERLLPRQWAGAACVVGAAFVLVLAPGAGRSPEPVVSEGALRIDPDPPPA